MWKKKTLVLFIVLFLSLFCSLNSEATIEEGGNITEDTVWTADDVHLVTTNIAVAAGITLTIEAGTIVKFNPGTSISVNQGLLVAAGDVGNKIVFTSYRDDEFGGDTNGDGLSQGQPGDWNRIYLNQAVACAHQPCEPEDTGTELKNCIIRYGGSGNNGNLYLYRSNISVVSSEITNGSHFGIYSYESSPLIQDSVIADNGNSGVYIYSYGFPHIIGNEIRGNAHGIYNDYNTATVTIQNNQITDNSGWGIYYRYGQSTPVLTGNTITGNYRNMIIPADAVPNITDGNVLGPNTINGIWIRGNARNSDLGFGVLYAGEAYEINTYQIYGTLTMNAGSTLTVDPGVVVKFYSGAGLDVHGALSAVGTSDLRVVFTSYKDDRYGGDLNLDGYGSSPANGDWRGIYFTNSADDANCVIDHAVIRFGGSANSGMVYSYQTDLSISNSIFSNSSTNGIRTYQASLELSNNEIFGNSGDGLRFESTGSHTVTGSQIFANFGDGIEVLSSANLTTSSSEIFGNVGYGIRSSSSGTVTATNNWWGAADGPGGDGPGSGDQISTNVTYDPFLTDGTKFSYFNAGPNTGEGTITAPTVTRGTDTSEFGSDARTRMLYDLEEVILDYSGVDAASRYEIFVTYCNGDDTSGVGGNIQRLTDGDDLEIHGSLTIPGISSPTQYYYYLMLSSHDDGTLSLKFIRENGFRAVVSQVWLVERSDTTDTTAPSSAITSPSSSDHLTGSLVEVTGTSTDGAGSGVLIVEVGKNNGSGISWFPVTQLRSDGTWSYRWSLPSDGNYTLYSRARDRAGNLETPGTGVAVVVNQTSPGPATDLSAFDTPEDSGSRISILWDLSLDDGAGADDVTGYDIERSEDASGPFSSVGHVGSGITSYADTTTTNGTQYYYQVITIDQAGNRMASSVYGPVISIDNNTPDSTPPEDVTGLSGTPGNEFVYLTWTRSADSALDLVDQLLDISTDGSSWGSALSLGKEAELYLADGLTNGTGYYFRIRVKDSSNNVSDPGVIIGPVTPSTTAVTTVSGTISTNTTWAAGVYYVSNNITVNSGVTLTILPGVIIKFAPNKSITVNGSLTAVGEAGSEVVFTAWTDDSFGGDSNGDGASTGTPGYWNMVQFTNTSVSSRLEDVVVRYGGSGSSGNIYINQADVPVISSEISNGSSYGISTYGCSPLIEGSTLADNESHGLYNYGGSPIVRSNTITGNNYGIYTRSASPTIDGNTITDNDGYGIYFYDARNAPEITNNTITGNAKPVRLPFSSLPGPEAGNTLAPNTNNQIEFWGNTLTRSLVLTAGDVNVYYQVGGNATVATGVKLTVEPGVVWKLSAGARLDVNGALYAVGTSSDKIVFTSYRDDEFGGDTNGGGFSTGQPGDWDRISFSDSVIDFLAQIEHVVIRYGGSGNQGSLYLDRSDISIISSEISKGNSFGIYVYNCSPLIEGNTISNNGRESYGNGLYLYNYSSTVSPVIRNNTITGSYTNGIYSLSSTPLIEGNTITDNGTWGIFFNSSPNTPEIKKNIITGNYRSMIIPVSAMPGSDAAIEDKNTLAPNTINGIWIRGSSRSSDLDFERLYTGESYEINTYQIYDTLTMSSGSKLTVAPGVVVKFYSGAGLTINGALDAQGTSDLPVVFTSYKDDRYGGDLNLDGYGSSPANGDWRGIYFTNSADDANCVIDHAVIRFGGSANSGMVYSYQTDLSISNSIFSNSSTNGIRTYQASLELSNNEIFGNSGDGLRFESTGSHTVTGSQIFANFGDGIEVLSSANLTTSSSEIFGNVGYGIRSSSSGTVTATNNWWGAADGPGGDGPGSGDQISTNVTYDPFLTDGTEFSYFNAGGSNHYGYGILQPVVSGTASSEWGSGDTATFLYNIDEQQIVAEYMGLSTTASYRIFLTYLNKDSGGSVQNMTNISGEIIHPSLVLPTSNPVQYAFPISRDLISGGNLTLNFNGLSGLRTVVSGIFLMKDDDSENILPVVHLTFPVNGEILKQEAIILSGTATDTGSGVMTVEVGIQKAGENLQWYPATTVSGSGLWDYLWSSPSSGEYTIKARAIDHDGNKATAPEVSMVTVDGFAPSPVTDLFAQGLSGTSGTIRVSWTLSLDDGSGADDVLRYEIFRSESQYTGFVLVGQVGAGISQFNDSTVTDGVDYYYYVSTVDLARYRSDSPVFGPSQSTGAVDATAPEDVTNLSASATQVPGGSPSALLTWNGSVDSEGDLADQLIYISTDGGTSWADAVSLGKHARNYQANGLTAGQAYTFKITTIDEVPNESIGSTVDITPTGAENETIALGGTLSDDTTLYAGVYYISSNLTIPVGITLTLGPGAILKFASGRYMNVLGTLIAVGEDGNPVVFTAYTDDSFGGDSNGDGASSGTPGYWSRLNFENTSSSRFEHVKVRYTGSGNQGSIYMNQSDVPVISSEISNGSSYGIRTNSCSPLIEGNTIADNENHGLYNYGGSPVVRNNTITGNNYGIYTQYATPTIDGNTITDNDGYGIYFYDARNALEITNNTITGNLIPILVPACALPDETNVLTPNTRKYIGIQGNDIQSDKVLRIWGKGTSDEISTYVVYSSNITVPAYTYLTVDPGVTVKFSSNLEMTVNGALIADGTLDEKIVFTSVKDDSYGGDTNNDGSNSIPENGNWRGITFNDSFFEDLTHLNHVKVRYAGANNSGAIYFYQADVLVENSEISNSSTNGIRVYNASPTLTGNNIWGNSADGIRLDYYSNAEITFNSISSNLSDGIEVTGSSNAIASNNRIFMNRSYGLRNSTTNSIDATQTWWGDADAGGPYHATTNSDGTGNQVSDNVVYDPWQTTVATEFSYVNFSAGSGSTYGSMAVPALTQGFLSDTWGTSPDRSIAWADESNGETVIVDYTGLDTEKRYKVRVSYYNGDPGGSIQSLTDGDDVQIHGSMIMPTSLPVQYEFSIPTVSYNIDGNLTLKFVHDNPDTSIRVAVPEVWLMEDIPELTPPRFVGVEYNDADGSSTLTEGDEFYFHFSEEMDTSLIADGTTDANDRLVPEGGLIYGTVNQSRWTADNKTVIVTLTEGFTVTGSEMVTPNGLADLFGNAAIGTQNLTTTDTIAPRFTGVDLVDADASESVSIGDQYIFHFNESMDVSVIEDGTQDANVYMRPSGGLRYGDVNTLSWSPDGKDLTVTITEGFTVLGDELVIPSSFVTDVAGNSATGTKNLVGRDITPPEFVGIRFDDADASGTVTEGDRYFFGFNEPMRAASLSDNTTEGNENLSPDGKKYGNVNSIFWNEDDTECVIRITVGFTVAGSEVVDPSDVVTDKAGNPVSNTGVLTLTDTIAPALVSVEANYISPLSAVDNFRLTVQFDSAMDNAVQPVIEMISSGTTNPVVPDGGTWLTTFYTNDTYVTPDIVLSAGMDGDIQVNVSGAEDVAGNAMSLMVNAYEFLLDATPPVSPAVSLLSSNCDSALLSWAAYTPPDDLAGFEVYKKVGTSFTTIDGLSPIVWIDKTAHTYEIGSLELNTSYYVAVVAVDTAGNKNATVVPVEIYISRSMPPQVSITVGPGDDPDSAIVSWHGYDTAGLCGFAGFRLYYEEFHFSSITGLTPKRTIDAAFREASVEGLDRTKTYYFTVVGFNDADEFNPEVVTAAWSDPYAGQITEDTVIGGGQQAEISISQTMVVTSGATLIIKPGTSLYFAPGTGIVVQSGALVIEGTALDPVIMTSENDREGLTPNPGDWNGITISAGGNGSILRHVFINYGQGLSLDGSPATVTVEALTAKHNSVCGLRLLNGASLSTSDALVIYNQVGVQIEDSAQLTISNSVIKINADYNAVAAGSNTMLAHENWWGATEAAGIGSSVSGTVDYEPYLSYEPLLTPAIGTLDGETHVGTREVTLKLACRTAEEMKISEDSNFQDVFFNAFAVTCPFTLSEGGGDKTVFAQFRSSTAAVSDPVSIQITYVTEGPEILSFSLNEGQTISRPLMVTGEATAILGMDTIEFYLNDLLIESAYGTSFSYLWDVRGLENRIHRVKLLARDLAGNSAASEKNVIINVMPPPAPMITEPASDIIVASSSLTVRGTAEPYITVRVTRNGTVVGTTTAGADGQFEVLDAILIEGSNKIMATALDDLGVSAQSNRVNVVMDSGPPAAPEMFEPSVVVGTGVVLEWKYAEIGERPPSFRVYRNDSLFSDVAQATLIEDDYLSLTYMDPQAPDGALYYAVLGVDDAGNASALSNVVVINYDSTSPSFGIVYNKIPPFGVGPVNITLTTTEKLFATPTLTITPFGSNSPEVVGLNKDDDFTYTGTYGVTADTTSGKTRVLVSGRDITGNTFSGEPSGVDFVVDTQGPVGSIVTDVGEPVQVLTDLDVNVTLSLSEFPETGTTPILRFTPPEGGAVNIPLARAETTWTGVLHLTLDMGSGNGRFTMEVQDDLGNMGTGFSAGEYLEIYNADVPSAPPAPVNLTAISRPGGEIDLSWSSVAMAETYRVYRADGDCITTPDVLVSDNHTSTSFTDIPSTDGNYCFGVTANRRGAESELSDLVAAVSDRVPPDLPENVAVSLGETGVIISWKAPGAGEKPDRYYVYRNGVKIRTISSGLSTTDHPPVGGGYDYSVASVDEVGNESLSGPVTFNLTVGAIANLQVLINNDDVPLLTWTSSDLSTVGYNVYRGGVKLNAALLTEPSFEDVFYAGSSLMEYAVVAVNAGAEESPPRAVQVYPISFEAKSNLDEAGDSRPLIANYFNSFEISVNNNDAVASFSLERVELHITADGDQQFAQKSTVRQNIEPGEAYSGTVVVPVADTDEDHLLRITAVQQNESGVVIYQRHFLFEVERAGVMVEMTTDSLPLAGGYSTINLCVSNFGYADMDIVVNRANGAEPGDIYVAIENADGLELSRSHYSGFPPGTKVAAGIGYVTLAPGETLCVDVQVLVPAALEEGTVLTFGGIVDKFAHDLTGIARESTAQLTGSMQSGITFSEYYGTAQADKNAYSNDEVVIISGQALNRDTDLPEPNVPLKIGFFTRGFKWFAEITTDESGDYVYEYTPTPGLSGEIVVWAAHPDVFDTLNQTVFSYHRMYTVPDTGDIRLSKADTLAFTISLYNPGTTPLTGFALQFRAYTLDSQGNEIPEPRLSGTATLPPDFEVGPGEKCEVELQLLAELEAPDASNVEYTFTSAEGAASSFFGAVTLAEAIPVITVEQPVAGYVDVSVDRGDLVTVPVTITNNGLRALETAELTLPANVAWMTINLPRNAEGKISLGDIEVGESRRFDVVFAPPSDLQFGYYNDMIVVSGSAQQDFPIQLWVLVTSDLTGSVNFIVKNTFNQSIEGATIRLTNYAINEVIAPVETDADGTAVITGLQEGEWSYQVIAAGHTSDRGTVTILADQIVLAEVYVNRELVTIDFTVVPVPFTDEYEIIVEQTFVTNVPEPVLVVEPPHVRFEDVESGFETTVMVKVSNYGLVDIKDLKIEEAWTDTARSVPLISYVPRLGVMQSIEVPFLITYQENTGGVLPPGGDYWDCVSSNPNFGEFMAGLVNLLAGSGNCYATAEQKAIMAAFATTLALLRDIGTLAADVVTQIALFLTCALDYGSGDWGKFQGEGKSYLVNRPTTNSGTSDGGAGCFVAGTPILLANGSRRPIESIRIGDEVMAYDGNPGRVSQVYVQHSNHIRELRYRLLNRADAASGRPDVGTKMDIRRLKTTDEHLFWLRNSKGWVGARNLVVGDLLIMASGQEAEILETTRFDTPVVVHTFDVDEYYSFFANGALIRQRCGGDR